MNSLLKLQSANTILYCTRWQETVDFYRQTLKLPVLFANDWFVEFRLTDSARLSIANQARATVKTSGGQGITIALQVPNAQEAWQALAAQGVAVGPLKYHPWGANVFYFSDPEGHRLEVWSQLADDKMKAGR